MLCDFEAESIENGNLFRLTCKVCGYIMYAKGPRAMRGCVKETSINKYPTTQLAESGCFKSVSVVNTGPLLHKTEPGLLQKAMNFSKAAIEHLGNGASQCTEDEIKYRASICMGTKEADYTDACEEFSLLREEPREGHCKKCGCGISAAKEGLVSKLAWASSHCPIGKWGKIEHSGSTS